MNTRWLQDAYEQGHRALRARQFRKAEAIGADITDRVPMRPEGWILLARASQQQCDPKAMALHAARAQDAAPERHDLTILRIEAEISKGCIASALTLLDRLAHEFGLSKNILQQVATLYTQLGRHHDAYHCAARLAAPPADAASARLTLANTALAIGELDEAIAILDDVITGNGADAEAQLARSNLRRVSTKKNHIAELKRRLSGLEGRDPGIAPLCYALGKELEDVGDFDAAFACFARGAARRRAELTYDVQADVAAITMISDTFDHTWWQTTEPSWASEAPIFILGLPRSGSTLIDRIIGGHPAVTSLGETNDFALAVMHAGGPAGDKATLITGAARASMTALSDLYLGATSGYGEPAAQLIDKTPGNLLYLGLIMKALPNARVVHVARHPIAAGYAMFKTLFRMGYPYSYDLSDIGSYWLAYDGLMAHWRGLEPGRILDVSYEDLVDDQEGLTRKILAHCGLNWSETCLDFHTNPGPTATASAAQVRQPLYQHARDIWRHYERQLVPLADQLTSAGVELHL